MKKLGMILMAAGAVLAISQAASAFTAVNCNDGNEYFCAQHYGMQVGQRKTESVRFDVQRDPVTGALTTYDRVTRTHAEQTITRESVTGGSPSDWAGSN